MKLRAQEPKAALDDSVIQLYFTVFDMLANAAKC